VQFYPDKHVEAPRKLELSSGFSRPGNMDHQETPYLNSQVADPNLTRRLESKTGLRSLFAKSKSVLGDRIHRHKHHNSLSETLPKDAPLAFHQNPSSSISLSRAATSSSISFKRRPGISRNKPRELTSWDPPPLFQAYPQSILYAMLDTSCLSADSIIKSDGNLRRGSTNEQLVGDSFTEKTVTTGTTKKRRDVSLKTHRRNLSASISSSGWTRKLFILITSGYLLQYSGEGHHDRLPEKILPLGKDSVAFASDAIPGRHWVLRVSQEGDHDEQIKAKSSNSGWSRFGFRSTEARRMAKGFLLVFDSPKELDLWMAAVRKEIEALGGVQYRVVSPSREPKKPDLEHRISRRYQIKRDPYQFSSAPLQQNHPLHDLHQPSGDIGRTMDVGDCDRMVEEHSGDQLPQDVLRRSIAASSILTSNELDVLRNSDTSSISATSGLRTSCEEPRTAPPFVSSPSTENNAKTWQPPSERPNKTIGIPSEHVLPTFSDNGDNRRLSFDSSPPKSPLFQDFATSSDRDRPVSLMPNFSLPIPSKRLTQVGIVGEAQPPKLPEEPGTVIVSVSSDASTVHDDKQLKQRRSSILAPLPTISNSPRYCNRSPDSTTSPEPIETNRSENHQQATAARPRRLSTNGNYSVHPKRYSSLEYSRRRGSPPSSPPQCDLPELPNGARISSKPVPRPVSMAGSLRKATPPKNLRHPVSMQIRTEVLKQCHSLEERSPSVTDAHFATCFGTQAPFLKSGQDEMATHSPPLTRSTSDASIFFAGLKPTSSPEIPPAAKKLSPQGSTPNLLSKAKVRPPPAGPPPSCPLPAVPGPGKRRSPRSRDILEYQREVAGKRPMKATEVFSTEHHQ
jgi:hypothetical protein